MAPWEPFVGAASYWSEWIAGERHELLRWPTDDIRIFYFAGVYGVLGLVLLTGIWWSRGARNQFEQFRVSAWMGIGLFATGSLLALPSSINLFGVQVPTPAAVIHALVPAIRFFWRYEYLALVGLVILGSIGWSIWLRNVSRNWRVLLTAGVVATVIVDLVSVVPFVARGFDFQRTPDVYTYLQERNKESPTAAVELTSDQDVGYTLQTWQVIHETELRHQNAVPGTPQREAIDALWGFVHPQTPCLATAIGAEYLIRHNSDTPIPAFPHQELVNPFRYEDQARGWPEDVREEFEQEAYWYDVDLYRNDLQSTTTAYLSYGQGFEGGTWDGVTGFAVMPGREGYLRVVGVPGESPSVEKISFSIRVVSEPQEVVISDLDGNVLWKGQIGAEWTNVGLQLNGPQMLRISKPSTTPESAVWLGAFGAGDCATMN